MTFVLDRYVAWFDRVECGGKLHPRRVPVERALLRVSAVVKTVGCGRQKYTTCFQQKHACWYTSGRHFACVRVVPCLLLRIMRLRLSAQPTSLESSLRHWRCIGVSSHAAQWTGGVALVAGRVTSCSAKLRIGGLVKRLDLPQAHHGGQTAGSCAQPLQDEQDC